MDDEVILTRHEWDDIVYCLKLLCNIIEKHEVQLDDADNSRIGYANTLLKNVNGGNH